jgi:hypothetical protein
MAVPPHGPIPKPQELGPRTRGYGPVQTVAFTVWRWDSPLDLTSGSQLKRCPPTPNSGPLGHHGSAFPPLWNMFPFIMGHRRLQSVRSASWKVTPSSWASLASSFFAMSNSPTGVLPNFSLNPESLFMYSSTSGAGHTS